MNMISSDKIKDALDKWLDGLIDEDDTNFQIPDRSAIGKWKRRSKTVHPDGTVARIFENTVMQRRVIVNDDEIVGWMADGNYAFTLKQHTHQSSSAFAGKLICTVTDLDYFGSTGRASDWHLFDIVFPVGFNEEKEGTYSVDVLTYQEAYDRMIDFGFVDYPAFNKFMSKY